MRGWVPSGQVEGEREGEGVLVRGAGRGLLGEGVGRGYGGVERGVVRGG